MATVRERGAGVWEVWVFTGRDAAGRTVATLLHAWIETNEAGWAPATRRDQLSRARMIKGDAIGAFSLARLSVADVDCWHARLRKVGVGDAGIRNRPLVLRAALSRAVRWVWVAPNVASPARLATRKSPPRQSMTGEEVRAVLSASADVGRPAQRALRLAAVTGARRSEIASPRWDDLTGDRLRI
jgi:integrase